MGWGGGWGVFGVILVCEFGDVSGFFFVHVLSLICLVLHIFFASPVDC